MRRGKDLPPGQHECWLCARPLGAIVERHHLVPKSRGGGGREVAPLHRLCHRTIHASFSNADLARSGNDVAALRGHPAIARFLDWVSGKPPDFHARTQARKSR